MTRLKMLVWLLMLAVLPWHQWVGLWVLNVFGGGFVAATTFWWLQQRWLRQHGYR